MLDNKTFTVRGSWRVEFPVCRRANLRWPSWFKLQYYKEKRKKEKKKAPIFTPQRYHWRLFVGNQDWILKKFRIKTKPYTECLLARAQVRTWLPKMVLLWISSSSKKNSALHRSAELPFWRTFNIFYLMLTRWLLMPELPSLSLAWCLFRGCKPASWSSQHDDLQLSGQSYAKDLHTLCWEDS